MAFTFNQITALTERHILKKAADGVFDSNPILIRFNQPNRKKLKDGGHQIIAPIISSKPGTPADKYYDEFDNLDNSPTDDTTASAHDWKQVYEPIRVGRKSILINSGDAAKLSLIATKMQIGQKNFKETLALGLFSDGTVATGALTTKQLTGFAAIIHATSTYGGLTIADFPEFAGVVKSNGGTNRPVSLPLLQQLEGSITEGDDRPSMFTCRQNLYDEIWGVYQPHQRIENSEMAKLGFSGLLSFNGKPIIPDSHNDANTVLAINEEYVFLAVHRDEDMRKETIERMETSNSMLMRLFWMGNVVCNNRRFQGKMTDLSVAS